MFDMESRISRRTSVRLIQLFLSLVLSPGLLFWSPAQAEIETITYLHTDHLGSPILATDQDGNVVWEQDYGPWGQPLQSGTPRDVSYTGHFEEGELELIYAGARWYDPEVGRFLGPDAVGFMQGGSSHFNRYVYGTNNPLKFIDPDGRESFLVSRPLGFTTQANHNFVVANANALGDPNADVFSFGDVGDDTMGLVDGDTQGFSAGTSDTDTKAWQSLGSGHSSATFRKIDAPDSDVEDLAKRVKGGLEYNAIPELQGGVNSNTAAGAIAERADRGTPHVENGIPQPGTSVTDRILFVEKK